MDKSQPGGIQQRELQTEGAASTKLKGKQGQCSENRKTSMDREQWLKETGKGRHQRSGWSVSAPLARELSVLPVTRKCGSFK